MSELAFDRVVIVEASGPRELSAAAFSALPLGERVRHVLQHSVRFYLGTSQIDAGAALRSLMAPAGPR